MTNNTTNVVSIADRKPVQTQMNLQHVFPQESMLYFEAEEQRLFRQCEHMEPVSTHKALARTDTGDQLAIVGNNYKIVQNKELFQTIEEQFTAAFKSDELKGVRVNDKMSYNGRECIREYIFPNAKCPIQARTSSEIAFRTVVVNGFGGSSVKLFTGAIDFFCTNGMITGEFETSYFRHTKGLKIGNIAKKVRGSIDIFYTHASVWQGWMGKKIEQKTVKEFLHLKYSARMANKLLRQYLIERNIHGDTVWALYSALTYYATHDEGEFETRKTDSDHSAATLLKREQQVRKLVLSPEWLHICWEAA